jgi:hypothetical protein
MDKPSGLKSLIRVSWVAHREPKQIQAPGRQSLCNKYCLPDYSDQGPDATLFRLSDKLDKAFIAVGRVIGNTALTNACRTQAEIELPPASLALLRTHPLGNHLLMIPGNYEELLRLVCRYKGIRVIDE